MNISFFLTLVNLVAMCDPNVTIGVSTLQVKEILLVFTFKVDLYRDDFFRNFINLYNSYTT